jgi:hypothetical protein
LRTDAQPDKRYASSASPDRVNLPKQKEQKETQQCSNPTEAAGGLKTRFVQAGDPSNPPLILMHGTAGSLENFAADLAAPARHANCIAFDMIGSGMTDFDYETDHYVKHAIDFLNVMDPNQTSPHSPTPTVVQTMPSRWLRCA